MVERLIEERPAMVLMAGGFRCKSVAARINYSPEITIFALRRAAETYGGIREMKHQTLSDNRFTDQANRAVREAAPWIERLGRFGYAARGVVYALVGWFAALAAAGEGGGITDKRGVLNWIEEAPFGKFLLIAIAVGLAGYALWRFIQAIRDTERKGSDTKGLAVRAAFFVIGLIYAALAFSAVRIATTAGDGGGDARRSWTAWLLQQPFGPWLVALAGAAVIGVGLYQFYKAYTAKFREKLKPGEMSGDEQKWVTRIGRFGLAARGVVFGITGGFLIVAAVESDASETRGLGGALRALAEQPYGPWLLGVTAAGLIAYGIFSMIQARYRRMVVR